MKIELSKHIAFKCSYPTSRHKLNPLISNSGLAFKQILIFSTSTVFMISFESSDSLEFLMLIFVIFSVRFRSCSFFTSKMMDLIVISILKSSLLRIDFRYYADTEGLLDVTSICSVTYGIDESELTLRIFSSLSFPFNSSIVILIGFLYISIQGTSMKIFAYEH